MVADLRPELVSFTYGVPSPDVIRRLGALGLLVMVTVTSLYEAGVADSMVVQGPNAGEIAPRSCPTWSPGLKRCIS